MLPFERSTAELRARGDLPSSRTASTAVSVFISYAREDDAFVTMLSEALRLNGIDVRSDRNLTPGEDYVSRLRAMILASDAFLYCLSTPAVLSLACRSEVETASECGKPILPIVCGELQSEELVPSPARSPQWFFVRETDDFVGCIRELVNAIHTDFEMLPQHRSVLLAAEGWAERGRPRTDLLRGRNLKAAQEWLRAVGQKTDVLPRPTRLQVEYIDESERSALRRMRFWVGAWIALTLGVGAIAIVAWQQRSQAFLQRDWRTATFAQTVMANDPTAAVRALADIPEGSTVWRQGRLMIADAISRGASQECVSGIGEISRIAVSPSGHIAAAISDSLLTVVQLPDCRILHKIVSRSRPMDVGVLDDRRVVTAHNDGALRIWISPRWSIAIPFSPIYPKDPSDSERFDTELAINHEAGLVAWGREDGKTIRVLDVSSRTVTTVETRVGQIFGLRFSRSGRYLAVHGPNTVEVLNVRTPREAWTRRFARNVNDVAFVDSGVKLMVAMSQFGFTGTSPVQFSVDELVGSRDSATLFLWDPRTGQMDVREQGACESPDALLLTQPEQALFAVRDENRELCNWRDRHVEVVRAKMQEFDSGVTFVGMPRRIAVSQDHSLIAVPSMSEDRTIRLWRPATAEAYALASPDARATDVVFLPFSRILLSGHEDGTLRLWSLGDLFSQHLDIPSEVGWVGNIHTSRTPLAMTGGGQFIIYGSVSFSGPRISFSAREVSPIDPINTNVLLLEIANGRVIGLSGHTGRITDAKTTTSAAELLTASMDSTVRSWSINSHKSEVLLRDTAGVTSLAVSRNGKIVVTVNAFGQLRGWRLADPAMAFSRGAGAREVQRLLPRCTEKQPLVAPGFTDTQFVIGCAGWLFVWNSEVSGLDSVRTPFRTLDLLATDSATRRAALSHDRELALVDFSTGAVRRAIAHLSRVRVLTFAKSGGDLLSAGEDAIWLWDEDLVHRRRLIGPYIGHPALAAVTGKPRVVTVIGESGMNIWSDSLPFDGPSLHKLAERFRQR